jgi:hypothetical protein
MYNSPTQEKHPMKNKKIKRALLWVAAAVMVLSGAWYWMVRAGYIPAPSYMGKQPAPHPMPAATRDGRWQQDVEYLGSQLPYLHVDPYFKVSETDFQRSVTDLANRVPNLNDEQIIVEMMRIVASIGDGHTRTYPGSNPVNFVSLPLVMIWLNDELIVTAANPENAQAVGAKVIQIGDHPVENVYEAVKPLIPADNHMQFLNDSPMLMSMPAILYGLDLIPQKDRVTFGFESRDGTTFTMELKLISGESEPFVSIYEIAGTQVPLYEQDRASFYWYRHLPESDGIYIQYNNCRNDKGKPFQKFVDEVFDLIDRNPGTRIVLDVRFNGGGNESVLNPFIEAVKERPSVNTTGKLFVIIGRGTYSSALQNAITLSLETNAILVGEPTGGKPNHYGEVRSFKLPNVGLRVQYSTRYWINYPGGDPLSLEPDMAAVVTVADLLAGRDPALEAAWSRP